MAEPRHSHLNLPPGYPRELSDEQITAEMNDIQRFLENGGFQINDVLRFTPLLQAGAHELQSRNLDREVKISREYVDTAKRLSIVSIGIAFLALAVAVGTSVLSYRALQQDTLIQERQLEALKLLTTPNEKDRE